MTGREDTAPPRSVAFDVLGGWLLLIAGALFLPWAEARTGTSFTLLAPPMLVAVVVGVCAFLAFAQYLAAIGAGLLAGLVGVLYGVDGVLNADRAVLGTYGGVRVSIGAWVLLLAGVGALVSSVAAFLVARKRF